MSPPLHSARLSTLGEEARKSSLTTNFPKSALSLTPRPSAFYCILRRTTTINPKLPLSQNNSASLLSNAASKREKVGLVLDAEGELKPKAVKLSD